MVYFDSVNIRGDFVSLSDPKVIKDYKSCYKVIGNHFPYPQFYNGLILNYLLFNLDQWSPENLAKLDEKSRIDAITYQAKEFFLYGCEQLEEEIGLEDLERMIRALTEMSKISKVQKLQIQRIPTIDYELDTWTAKLVDVYR